MKIREGKVRKGGLNRAPKPSTRPDPPVGTKMKTLEDLVNEVVKAVPQNSCFDDVLKLADEVVGKLRTDVVFAIMQHKDCLSFYSKYLTSIASRDRPVPTLEMVMFDVLKHIVATKAKARINDLF